MEIIQNEDQWLKACSDFGFEASMGKFCFKEGKICSCSRVPTAKILTHFKIKFAARSPKSEQALRRVPFTDPAYIKEDGSHSSFAFKTKNGEHGPSVNIARMTTHKKAFSTKHVFDCIPFRQEFHAL